MFFLYFLNVFVLSEEITIDFGSFYTKAAHFSDGHPQILTNLFNKRITPSFIAFRNTENVDFLAKERLTSKEISFLEPEIGSNAIQLLESRPYSGTGFFSAFTDAAELYSENLSNQLNIVNPITKLRFGYFNLTSAFIRFYITELYKSIPEKLKINIVVPHSFTIPQMHIIKTAFHTAGFPNIQFLKDVDVLPLHFINLKGKAFYQKNVLFIDIGATSTKSYLIGYLGEEDGKVQIEKNSYEIDHSIGGSFITHDLVEHFKQILQFDSYTEVENRRLFGIAEKAKLTLTLLDKATLQIDDFRGKNFDFTITRREFENLIQLQTTGIMNLISRSIGNKQVDHVEIIGGSSRIPIVQHEICQKLKLDKLGKSLNADEALVISSLNFKNYTSVFTNRIPFLSVVARFNNDTQIICTTNKCYSQLILRKHPEFLEFRYYKHKSNPSLNTRRWIYRWKNKDNHHSNLLFFNKYTHDVEAIIELNGTLVDDKNYSTFSLTPVTRFSVELPLDMYSNFVSILDERSLSKKEVSKLLNSIENGFFELMKKGELRKSVSRILNENDKKLLLDNLTIIEQAMSNGFKNSTEDEIRQYYRLLNYYKYKLANGKRAHKEYQFCLDTFRIYIEICETLSSFPPGYNDQDFIRDYGENLTMYFTKITNEAEKPLETQDFDLQEIDQLSAIIKKKYNQINEMRNEFFERRIIKILMKIRSILVKLINKYAWYFQLFERFVNHDEKNE